MTLKKLPQNLKFDKVTQYCLIWSHCHSKFCWKSYKLCSLRAVVMALLVEPLLLTPEVRCSNPVIGNFLNRTFVHLLSTVLKRRK